MRSSGVVGRSWEWEELDLNGRQLAVDQKQVRGAVLHSFITNLPLAEPAVGTDGKMDLKVFS